MKTVTNIRFRGRVAHIHLHPPASSPQSLQKGLVEGVGKGVGAAIGAGVLSLELWKGSNAGSILEERGIHIEEEKSGSVILSCMSTARAFMDLCDDIDGVNEISKDLSAVLEMEVLFSIDALTAGFDSLNVKYLRQELARRVESQEGAKLDLVKRLEKVPIKKVFFSPEHFQTCHLSTAHNVTGHVRGRRD